ncbi:MAG: hypothetical protein NTX50_31215, partial [Candidatus Sumerlaeota bacterium]|nr:hypothetical protein [Candidatus Sumerlaeota bacterium]
AVRQWTEHAQAKGWTGTSFQIYLNHKYSYKGCNALWILEECVTADDFRAVGFFHSLFRAGAEEAKAASPSVRWHFRLDISDRWGQNYGQLDTLINWYCINSGSGDWHWPNIRYRNILLGGGAQGGSQNGGERYVWYGTGPAPQDSGVGHARRFLQAWAQGLDGGVPYWDNFQTDWSKAQALSVVYSGKDVPGFGPYEGPIMSVRVKMMRQAQQIVELANVLAARPGWNRERVAQAIFQKYGDGSWNRGFSGLDEAGIYRLKADLLAALK